MNKRTYIISEIGNNHNGSFERAIEMIDKSKKMGVDAVKFQMRDIKSLYRKNKESNNIEDLGTEYILDLLKKYDFSRDTHYKIRKYCNQIKVEYICSPWDIQSLKYLDKFKLSKIKIASADLTNLPLIREVIKRKKEIILSTGMSKEDEILKIIKFLKKNKSEFTLLHCNSTYPAPASDINLRYIERLKKIHHKVGYSGHERGTAISIAAVALGASIIERHFTLDRTMEGPDHAASLEENEFSYLVSSIREIESALGSNSKRILAQGEMINRENLAKSIVARKSISKNDVFTNTNLEIKSPGRGLSPLSYEKLIGKKSNRNIQKGDFLYNSDLKRPPNFKLNNFKFNLNWGIPVRFHDFMKFKSMIKPKIWEFHLSYSDLSVNFEDYIKENIQEDFCIHAPELFSNSSLLDLASRNKNYLKLSMDNILKVIELTLKLKSTFLNTKKPLIIANVGGHSMDQNIDESEKLDAYEILGESLIALKSNDYEIIPQNMAPFPWHFGGQRFQNLLVYPKEITDFGKKNNINFCIDTSHMIMTCNHFNLDMKKYLNLVHKYTKHLHIADAKGINQEGLQIGDGDSNFDQIIQTIRKKFTNISFIPEIWQGHKDHGKDFWIALNHLNKKI